MWMPSADLKESLGRLATSLLRNDQVVDYLAARGISRDTAAKFRLGGVPNDQPQWSQYAYMLGIPYPTPGGVVSFKFRHISADHTGPKYLGLAGGRHHLYNAPAVMRATTRIVVCEGELDAVVVEQCGVPAVAAAGVKAWKPHFDRLLDGINDIVVIADNDDKADGSNPGREFGEFLCGRIRGARMVLPPKGMDVTDLFVAEGEQAVVSLVSK